MHGTRIFFPMSYIGAMPENLTSQLVWRGGVIKKKRGMGLDLLNCVKSLRFSREREQERQRSKIK